jgi:hypothetical protein
MRVTHQMGGRVGGRRRCPLIMQLARLDNRAPPRLFSIFDPGLSLLERENASACTRWAALTIFGPLCIWITVWDVIKGFASRLGCTDNYPVILNTFCSAEKFQAQSSRRRAPHRWSLNNGQLIVSKSGSVKFNCVTRLILWSQCLSELA